MAWSRKRWPPASEFKKMVAIAASEVSAGSVQDVFHNMRRRFPDWLVTPHRVRKALVALQNSKKKGGKQGRSSASADGSARVYPHDVVELRPHASKGRQAQWQWRGQVLRVAGYDDGEASEEEEQELPPGFCSVSWLGHGLEQWLNAMTKETSMRVVDRPWCMGDRVAKIEDPRSLGTVVRVKCRRTLSPLVRLSPAYTEVSGQCVRPVGGFRAEDWVANESAKWIGKVEEAVFRVEVELCGKKETRQVRSKGRGRPPACVFQVSSEGLQGLDPAGSEDVSPQELSPYFPGQRVRAPARLFRQAEWIRGSLGRSPRRGMLVTGVVVAVGCDLLAVRWQAGAMKDSQPPDEWVSPDSVQQLFVSDFSEGWALGDHVQASAEPNAPSAVISASQTLVDVQWADGTVEEDVQSTKLCPRPHFSAHDFLPNDFVARSGEGFGDLPAAGENSEEGRALHADMDQDASMDGYLSLYGQQMSYDTGDAVMHDASEDNEILPLDSQEDLPHGLVTPLGVVTGVNLQARTAEVRWAGSGEEPEEVSVFELTDHPQVDVRLMDAVILPDAREPGAWAGRVQSLSGQGCATVQLLHGGCQEFDVRDLMVVDDGDGPPADMMEDAASSRSSDSEVQQDDEAQAKATDLSRLTLGETRTLSALALEAPVRGGGANEVSLEDLRDFASCLPSRRGRRLLVASGDGSSHGVEVCMAASGDGGGGGSSSSGAVPSPEVLAFDVMDEDVDPSDHHFGQQPSLGTKALMMAVRREMAVLKKGLLEGKEGVPAPIVVRAFAARSDLFRVMVVGPPDTPYAHVPFFFDLALSAQYPREPPLAHFHAHYVGNERLNPNLYVDGKVCLSLLGTWSGPAWDPQQSTLLQVLVSLQGLVLVEEPYFNEPGHECDAGTEHGKEASALYNENARLLALRAALNAAQRPPKGFTEIVAAHFARFGPKLVEHCEEALREPNLSATSEGFRKVLAKSLLPRLREQWPAPSSASSASV